MKNLILTNLVSLSLIFSGTPAFAEDVSEITGTDKPPSWTHEEKVEYDLSNHFLRDASEIARACDQKVTLDQKLNIMCSKRRTKAREHAEKRSKDVKDEIMIIKDRPSYNPQADAHKTSAISSNEAKYTFKMKIKNGFIDKLCQAIPKWRSKIDYKKEDRLSKKCVKKVRKASSSDVSGSCKEALNTVADFIEGKGKFKTSFIDLREKPMFPERKEKLISYAKKIVDENVSNKCKKDKRKVKKFRKACKKLISEVKENLVKCRGIKEDDTQKRTSFFNHLLSIIPEAHASSDKAIAEKLLEEYSKTSKRTILKYQSSPLHRRAIYDAVSSNIEIAGKGHNKNKIMKEYETGRLLDLDQKNRKLNNGASELPLLSRDYSLKTGDSVINKDELKLEGKMASDFAETIKLLKPYGVKESNLKSFISDLYVSSSGPVFPASPAIEGRLYKNAALIGRAIEDYEKNPPGESASETAMYNKKFKSISDGFNLRLAKNKPTSLPETKSDRMNSALANINSISKTEKDEKVDEFSNTRENSDTDYSAKTGKTSSEKNYESIKDESDEFDDYEEGISISLKNSEIENELLTGKDRALAHEGSKNEEDIVTNRSVPIFKIISNRYLSRSVYCTFEECVEKRR